jgi:hypothetical protein
MHRRQLIASLASVALLLPVSATAHDPIFGLGPHVLYKDGIEAALQWEAGKAGPEQQQTLALELSYGLTGDWAVGMDLPYGFVDDGSAQQQGRGDLALFTKYRFWRADSLALQRSAALALKIVTDTAGDGPDKGATDVIAGLSYGHEGRHWYGWASARYRYNGEDGTGLKRGDRWLLDVVGGIRPEPRGYLETDTVWLLELNTEIGRHAERRGVSLPDTGGTEVFLSPGIFWTWRNFAIKAGVQVPVYADLHGHQAPSDYRLRLTFENHF